MFLEFGSCQLPNYAENANFQIRISQNAKNPFHAPLLVNPRYDKANAKEKDAVYEFNESATVI